MLRNRMMCVVLGILLCENRRSFSNATEAFLIPRRETNRNVTTLKLRPFTTYPMQRCF